MCAAAFIPFETVLGQNAGSPVAITQVNPSSKSATVNTPVLLQGTISSLNGIYQIFFNQTLVSSGNSNGYYVTANFNVPELPGGNYTLTLRDVASNQTATDQFQVTTTYSITPISPQITESSSVTLNVKVTGGNRRLPTPLTFLLSFQARWVQNILK